VIPNQPTLMRRVLMKNVRGQANQAIRLQFPNPGRKMLAVLIDEGLGRLIHVGDIEIAVDQHKSIGRDISSAFQVSGDLALHRFSRVACGMAIS
jgi:hypothetical protein